MYVYRRANELVGRLCHGFAVVVEDEQAPAHGAQKGVEHEQGGVRVHVGGERLQGLHVLDHDDRQGDANGLRQQAQRDVA